MSAEGNPKSPDYNEPLPSSLIDAGQGTPELFRQHMTGLIEMYTGMAESDQAFAENVAGRLEYLNGVLADTTLWPDHCRREGRARLTVADDVSSKGFQDSADAIRVAGENWNAFASSLEPEQVSGVNEGEI